MDFGKVVIWWLSKENCGLDDCPVACVEFANHAIVCGSFLPKFKDTQNEVPVFCLLGSMPWHSVQDGLCCMPFPGWAPGLHQPGNREADIENWCIF